MSVKRGLGRGLGALLGEPAGSPPGVAVRQLSIAAIRPNPHQPRKHFDDATLAELASSIEAHGVLVPVLVRAAEGGYELLAGERRWRASTIAGRETIPAIVRDVDDREGFEVAMVENLQREDLDPLAEAMGLQHLVDSFGLTQDEVAGRVGRSRPAVANALRLLTLPDDVKGYVREGRLSAGHARALLALPAAKRSATARQVIERGLTVRAIERLSHGEKSNGKRVRKPVASGSADDAGVVDRLRYRFATPVALARRGAGGSLEIRFADDEELTRIVDLLLGE